MLNLFILIIIAEAEQTYPDTVTLSSTGGAFDDQSASLGVYKITNQTYSSRPVYKMFWESYDRFLFYIGNIKYILEK